MSFPWVNAYITLPLGAVLLAAGFWKRSHYLLRGMIWAGAGFTASSIFALAMWWLQ